MRLAIALSTVFLALTAVRPAGASPISILVGDKDGFGLGLTPGQQIPCLTSLADPSNPQCLAPIHDLRSAAEAVAISGAQFTDTYSALYDGTEFDCPAGCSPNGATGTVTFNLPLQITSAAITMFIGDFESSLFNAMSANINGIPISFFYDDGFRNTSVRTIVLTQSMIDAANAAGRITLFLDHSVIPGQIGPGAGSFDYVMFDYFEVNAEAVPEPGTWLLIGTGLALVSARLRRRSKPTA